MTVTGTEGGHHTLNTHKSLKTMQNLPKIGSNIGENSLKKSESVSKLGLSKKFPKL